MITWDEFKRRRVIKKHGVDLAKVGDVFSDPFAIDFEDFDHSSTEHRRIIIGKCGSYGLVFVSYVVRGEEIHCITARRAEPWMTRMYEKQRKRP